MQQQMHRRQLQQRVRRMLPVLLHQQLRVRNAQRLCMLLRQRLHRIAHHALARGCCCESACVVERLQHQRHTFNR